MGAGLKPGTLAATPRSMAAYSSRVFSPAVLEAWWVQIPGKLRPYSQTLWAVWSDGMYLTAWPRAALVLPWAALLLGFVEGATHWSLLTLGNDKVSLSDPAVIFAQCAPMLFIVALLGSLSAQLGLMLASGYALGDYLIAGPVLTILNPNPISGFLYLRVPQLLCYALFLTLAATPPLASSGLLHPFARRLAGNRLFSVIVRTAALAAVTMTLVYGWTLVAPLVFRVVWSWPGQGPPISVKYFREVLNPWLPITAGLGIVARTVLGLRTRDDQQLQARTRRVLRQAALADGRAAWPRRLPAWFRATLSAAWPAFLLAGMMTTWPLAALVCSALVGLFLLRNCVSPKIGFWARWTRKVTVIPLIFRIAIVVVATYFVTQGLLQIPGWTISQNAVPGQFGIVLACAAASLLINFVVIPYAPAGSTAAAERAPVLETAPEMRVAVQVLLLVFFLFLPLHALAVCNDPSCCFGGDNGGAGGPLGAMGGGMGMGAAGGIGGSGEGGSGGEGGGSSGGPDGGGDDPAPSSDGGPSGEGGGGGGGSSASGSSPDQGTGNAGGPGSASSPGDSGNSAPGSGSGQGTSDAGPGPTSSPGDSGNSAPSSSSGQGTGDTGGPGSASSPDDSGSTDGQQQYSADQLQKAADDFQQQASQDQTAANYLQQQASQEQADANALQQGAKEDDISASALRQLASEDQQSASELNQAANDAENPAEAAALHQLANEAAEQAAYDQQGANQAEQEAAEYQQLANQAAQEAADLRNGANQATQEAAQDRQLANELSSDAQAQRNAAAPMNADQPTAGGTQGSPTSQPPPPPYNYSGPKKPS